nr:coat protein [Cucumber necrosis virus]
MALVSRNNNMRTLAKLAAPLATAGTRTIVDNKEAIWNGVKWIWGKLPKGKKGKNGNGALIAHPQAFPGAIAAPVSYAYAVKGRKPRFQTAKGSVRITHREYVSVLSGTNGEFLRNNGTGPNNDFSINPLNPFLFPWLVNIAANFDQYKFNSLRFEYVPLVNTTTNGRVALYFDKDSEDPGPDDRAALANYAHLSEISPWAITKLTVPTDNVKRFISDTSSGDPKLINLGQFGWVAYSGPTAELGDIFVEYTVDLFEAQPTSPLLESLFRESASSVQTRVGLPYFSLEVASATDLVWQARVPGTYVVTIIFNSTVGGLTPSISGGGTINSSFSVSTAGSSAYVANITIRVNANLSLSGLTGATNAQLFAVRAITENAVQVV